MHRISLAFAVVLCLTAATPASSQQPGASAVSGWVALPAAGATWAAAYVEVSNPTMYDIYVVSATAEGAAARVELREGAQAGAEPTVVKEFAVPAYGSTSAAPTSPHLRLVDLSRPLKAGDTVELRLKTDGNTELTVRAEVRAQ